jgi:hypothetical protein
VHFAIEESLAGDQASVGGGMLPGSKRRRRRDFYPYFVFRNVAGSQMRSEKVKTSDGYGLEVFEAFFEPIGFRYFFCPYHGAIISAENRQNLRFVNALGRKYFYQPSVVFLYAGDGEVFSVIKQQINRFKALNYGKSANRTLKKCAHFA